MSIQRATGLTLILAAGLLLGGGAPAVSASEMPPELAVAQLNEWRAKVGLNPVTHDPAASEGCRLHANYYRLTGEQGHDEDPAKPGYTLEGWRAARSSMLAYGVRQAGPYTWESAVYHRLGLLQPHATASGFWSEFGLTCMSALPSLEGRTATSLRTYPYPYDGQQGVTPNFVCGSERPDPCEGLSGVQGSVGFIASVQFDGPWTTTNVRSPVVDEASLVPDGGAPATLSVQDDRSAMRVHLRGGVALIPHVPLAPETWYTARVRGRQTPPSISPYPEPEQPFDVAWRFRTGPAAPVDDPGTPSTPSVRLTAPGQLRIKRRAKSAVITWRKLSGASRYRVRLRAGRTTTRNVTRTRLVVAVARKRTIVVRVAGINPEGRAGSAVVARSAGRKPRKVARRAKAARRG